jgi:penicillin-binding protein 1A
MAMPIWALFMQKVYADKTIKISTGDFEKPTEPIHVELDCAKYRQESEGGSGSEDRDF